MKIQIVNQGPISKFDFDLSKDLNIIFGKNNIGKSYAITAIYLIVKNLISESFYKKVTAIGLFVVESISSYVSTRWPNL